MTLSPPSGTKLFFQSFFVLLSEPTLSKPGQPTLHVTFADTRSSFDARMSGMGSQRRWLTQPNVNPHSSDLSCAQSAEGDGNVHARVPAGGARHEHARIGAGFAKCLFAV